MKFRSTAVELAVAAAIFFAANAVYGVDALTGRDNPARFGTPAWQKAVSARPANRSEGNPGSGEGTVLLPDGRSADNVDVYLEASTTELLARGTYTDTVTLFIRPE
jgi:hypothetical protein